jgi:hypothetical protein
MVHARREREKAIPKSSAGGIEAYEGRREGDVQVRWRRKLSLLGADGEGEMERLALSEGPGPEDAEAVYAICAVEVAVRG